MGTPDGAAGAVCGLVQQLNPVFFNHRIGQNFMRDGFKVKHGLLARLAICYVQFEEFALTHVGNGGIAKAVQSGSDSLALRIEDCGFGGDEYAGFHRKHRLSHAASRVLQADRQFRRSAYEVFLTRLILNQTLGSERYREQTQSASQR